MLNILSIKQQVDKYNELKIYQSYRGLTALFLILHTIVSSLLFYSSSEDIAPASEVPLTILVGMMAFPFIFALMIYKGNRVFMAILLILSLSYYLIPEIETSGETTSPPLYEDILAHMSLALLTMSLITEQFRRSKKNKNLSDTDFLSKIQE